MRALITGADGFVGTQFVPFLRDRGWDVVAVGGPRDAEHPIDLTDAAQVEATIANAAPFTHVFHLAAVTYVPEAAGDPARTIDVNVAGTIRLVEAVRRYAPNARIVYVSTSEAYGAPDYLPMDETHPLNAANPYAIAKAAADAYCRYTVRAEHAHCVIARPFNHAGAGQNDRFALSSFAKQIAMIEAGAADPVLRVGNLSAARDYTHVDDILRAYELIATKGQTGEAYNICTGTARPLEDAVELLLEMVAIDIRVEIDPKRLRPVDVPEVRGTAAKLTAATGWKPEKSLGDILRDLLEYWRRS